MALARPRCIALAAVKLSAINRRHRGHAHAHAHAYAYPGNNHVRCGIGAYRSTHNSHWGRNTRAPARNR